jgi:hypothetical protein
MKLKTQLAALIAIAVIFGCSTSSNEAVTIPLNATSQNFGQIANATLVAQGKETGFTFIVSGAPSGTTLPLHLYTFVNKGSCEKPGAVAFAMNDRVNIDRISSTRGWTYSRNAPVAMSALFSGEYSIVVRTAPADGSLDIFCGDIKQQAR